MIRPLALLGLLALAACGSGGPDPIMSAAMGEVGGLWGRGKKAEGPPPKAVTRADIERANVAAIQARLASDRGATLMYAASSNRGRVTYVSALRQSVTLRGVEITGTRGLGTDLLSGWATSTDPLASAIPPSSWPAGVERVYEFPGEGPQGRIESYDCRFEPGKPASMTILQRSYSGVEIAETCTGPAGSFENLHFVDAGGTVWRSLQWIGPAMDHLDIQVLEPYTGG